MRPPCYNRPPRDELYLANDGVHSGVQRSVLIPVVFVDRCATWDGVGIGSRNEPYPIAHGWDCSGCRWLPDGVTLPVNSSPSPEALGHE